MRMRDQLGQLFIIFVCLFGGVVNGQGPVDWLPSSTLLYAELGDPDGVLDRIENHALTRRLFELPEAQEAFASEQFRDLKTGISLAEVQMDATWQEIVGEVAGQGVIFAIDGDSDAVVVMMHSKSEASSIKALEAIERLAKLDAVSKGTDTVIKTGDYRGLTGYSAGEARWVRLGEWIAITNQAELGKSVIDRYLDKSQDHLGSKMTFSNAIQNRETKTDLWAWIDVEQLRQKNPDEDIYQERTDNPITELLLGGLLNISSKTDDATLGVQLDDQEVRLRLNTTWNERWITEPREYYWGYGGTGEAPGHYKIENSIFQLSAYRDVAAMWLRAEELLQDDAVDGIVQANSVLSTLFSGKDFGEDILAELEPTIDLVVANRSFSEDQPQPAVKLPAFALAFELSDPEAMQPQMRRIFQSLIGFLNITGAMNGQPQIELDMERTDESQFVLGRFLAEEEYEGGLPVQFNLTPTLGFSGSRFVLSSDLSLAKELVEAERVPTGSSEVVTNVAAEASISRLGTVLLDNRESLVAQNMLEEGNDREDAESDIDTLFSIMQLFKTASFTMKHTDDLLSLELTIETLPQD